MEFFNFILCRSETFFLTLDIIVFDRNFYPNTSDASYISSNGFFYAYFLTHFIIILIYIRQ